MKRLSYSENARDDLIRLREFIAQKSPATAKRIGLELVLRIEKLRIFSEMGISVVPKLSATISADSLSKFSLREMAFGHYVVRYSVHPDAVLVLRIWHQLEERQIGNVEITTAVNETHQ